MIKTVPLQRSKKILATADQPPPIKPTRTTGHQIGKKRYEKGYPSQVGTRPHRGGHKSDWATGRWRDRGFTGKKWRGERTRQPGRVAIVCVPRRTR